MKTRLLLGPAFALAIAAACSPTPQGGGTGSNTSWLSECDADAECGSALGCYCGLCLAECETQADCGDLPGAQCALAASQAAHAVCQAVAAADVPTGICLASCGVSEPCADGWYCIDRACSPNAPPIDPCGASATLTLTSSVEPLQTRHGMLFMDAFYAPVAYADEPAGWTDPVTPAELVARVTDAQGAPSVGCALAWTPASSSGWVYPEATETDANGEVRAVWVAGPAEQQTLSVALDGAAGDVVNAEIQGEARAHDAPPVDGDPAVAVTTVAPTMVHLSFPLSSGADAVETRLEPVTFPYFAYYGAASLPGFFTGLQNVSDQDASTGALSPDQRILIASVWNVPEGDGLLLWSDPEATCVPHDQDTGGIRCTLMGAWELGNAYVVTTEFAILASGAAPSAELVALGYLADPCVSAVGCIDYTVHLRVDGEAAPGRRVAALRYHQGEAPIWALAFIDAFTPPAQQAASCLYNPSYQVRVSASERVGGQYQPLQTADFGAAWLPSVNSVCANYAAERQGEEFLLATGATEPVGRPLLPGEPPRPIE